MPATLATMPPDITIGLKPLVLLKIMPLRAPAATLFAVSSASVSQIFCNDRVLRTHVSHARIRCMNLYLMVISAFVLDFLSTAKHAPLYTIATTPAELPKNGPRRVTAFNTLFSLIFGGALGAVLRNPSTMPQAPPVPSATK